MVYFPHLMWCNIYDTAIAHLNGVLCTLYFYSVGYIINNNYYYSYRTCNNTKVQHHDKTENATEKNTTTIKITDDTKNVSQKLK